MVTNHASLETSAIFFFNFHNLKKRQQRNATTQCNNYQMTYLFTLPTMHQDVIVSSNWYLSFWDILSHASHYNPSTVSNFTHPIGAYPRHHIIIITIYERTFTSCGTSILMSTYIYVLTTISIIISITIITTITTITTIITIIVTVIIFSTSFLHHSCHSHWRGDCCPSLYHPATSS